MSTASRMARWRRRLRPVLWPFSRLRAMLRNGMKSKNHPDPTATPGPSARRDKLNNTLVSTATRLLPLVELVERIRPHMANDSVFTSRREKMNAQLAIIQEQLKSERPRRETLVQAFKTLSEFVREESHEVSKDEVKESAKRLVLVALKTAPDLIRAAHTAGLFS